MRVTVFFEDKLAEGSTPKDYGLGNLIRAMAEDQLGLADYGLRGRLQAEACNGNGNVLNKLTSAEKNGHPYPLVAAIDRDRLPELLGLQTVRCNQEAKDAIRKRTGTPTDTPLVFIVENTESILKEIASADVTLDPETFQKALQKDRISRDRILNRAAFNPETRKKLRDSNASLTYLVDKVATLLATPE